MYNKSSGREPGTIYYFRNLHGRTNVKENVKNNYAAAEGMLLHLATAYIVSAFMYHAGMSDTKDRPKKINEPGKNVTLHGYNYLREFVGGFVDQYCLFEPDLDKIQRKQQADKEEKERKQQPG